MVCEVAAVPAVGESWGEATPILGLPGRADVLPLAVSMLLLALYAAARLLERERRLCVVVGAGVLALLGVGMATRSLWLPWFAGDNAIIATVTFFILAILVGVPVGFVLLMATASYLWVTNAPSLVSLPQSMVNGTGNYILLAVPFFIFAGLIMERGGISLRLVRFVETVVGHLRGGLLQVRWSACTSSPALSGSKPADVAAVGTVMRDGNRASWFGRGRGRAGRLGHHG